MKELNKLEIEKLLKKKKINPRISWLYIQFKNIFEEEYVIDKINLNDAIKNLVNFLKREKIEKVMFFPELGFPGINGDVPFGIIETYELEKFLKENIDIITNSHVADQNLDWIFTITHESDFFISGDKNLIQNFIKFFKNAKCTPQKEIEKKWKNK